MKVSVVIPCHNSAATIGRALCSIAAQEFAAHEVIVVDDASTDGLAQAVREAGVATTLLQVSVRNAAAARNAGIEAATGDWLAFLDADCVWFAQHLRQARELLEAGGDQLYMCHSVRVAAVHGLPPQRPTTGLHGDDVLKWRLAQSIGFPTNGLVARRDLVKRVGGFDITQRRRHDVELFMRLACAGTWAFHPEPSWKAWPPRPGDISANHARCKYFECRAVLKNETLYAGPQMRELIRRVTRSAMIAAVIEGDEQDIQQAIALAYPRLRRRDKLVFACAARYPSALRRVLNTWRWCRHRGAAADRMVHLPEEAHSSAS